MPVPLSDITGASSPVEIPWGDKSITMEVRWGALTRDLMADLIAERDDGSTERRLCELVASWDILESEDGPPVPITEETMAILPQPLKRKILDATVAAARAEGKG